MNTTRNKTESLFAGLLLAGALSSATAATTISFDDLTFTGGNDYTGAGGGKYYNGSDEAGYFATNESSVVFLNTYNITYSSWYGFSYSNTTDTTTAGYTNQYSAYTGGGYQSPNYGVGYYSEFNNTASKIQFTETRDFTGAGVQLTNTTYAALSMKDGDGFAKKFGGATGNDPDWFKLTIQGIRNGNQVGTTIEFYLADFRFADNTQDYMLSNWTHVDLSALGSSVDEVWFTMSSSDNSQYGMNTPAYFAMDDLTIVPEPVSSVLVMFGAVFLLRRRR